MSTTNKLAGVTYNIEDNLKETSDRAITAWIRSKKYAGKEYNIISIIKDETITIPANYKIRVGTSIKFSIGDTFVISNGGALNFYAKVIDDSASMDGTYYCQIDKDVEDHLDTIKSDWTNVANKGYKLTISNSISILNGVNSDNTGFSASIYANQYVKIIYGTQTKVIALKNKLLDESWYGVVINVGSTFGQYSIYIWEEWSGNKIDKIRIREYETSTLNTERVKVESYTINKSDAYITNIRLFNTTIAEEKQATELLSYFSKDGDQLIIGDNCDPRMKIPYISQQK